MRIALIFLLVIGASVYMPAQCDPNAIFNNTGTNAVCTEVDGAVRYFYSNSLPDHSTGMFPNPGNPNAISALPITRSMCAYPAQTGVKTFLDAGAGNCPFWEFGIMVNGILADPIAAEFFTNPNTGEQNRNWNENALSPNVNLGLDTNDAHVQPNGKYHYHGIPTGLIQNLGVTPGTHSPLIGYAADGYPVYYKYGYEDPADPTSNIVELKSCYQLKQGNRPGNGITAPDGLYDGTYTQDYEYSGGGNCFLDECNGRYGVTPEYPNGTYYYVMTSDFPVIPRCFTGAPDRIFTIGPPPAGCSTSNSDEICSLVYTLSPLDLIEAFHIFPNPVQTQLQLQLDQALQQDVENIQILDSSGRQVWRVAGWSPVITLSDFPAGPYFLQLTIGDAVVSKKFIRQ
ncbi:MAG: YHYH protein [Bacteroidetes bacterium]|nr:MAG: YHYH protein [Bacteroidota bacterium]